MAELLIDYAEDDITLRLGEYQCSVTWAEVNPTQQRLDALRGDAAQYGRALYDLACPGADLRNALANISDGERLLIVADETAAAVPWEYLREPDGALLAARLNVVRSVPEQQRRDARAWSNDLELLAIPVSPINEARKLNTEREWDNLVRIARKAGRALRLTRVRPPALSRMERALGNAPTTWVWFMGHSGSSNGNAVLLFEDEVGLSQPKRAAEFAQALDESVQFVLLNSCESSAASARTEFGNIARGLVSKGVPYALGMQFSVPDDAALKLSEALFDFLLKGRDIEDAVRRARRALAGV